MSPNAVAPFVALLGTTEIFVILAVVILLFGARKIPELMKGVGTGIKEFKKASREDEPPTNRPA